MSVVGEWAREMTSELIESRKHEIYFLETGRRGSGRCESKGFKRSQSSEGVGVDFLRNQLNCHRIAGLPILRRYILSTEYTTSSLYVYLIFDYTQYNLPKWYVDIF